jgi:transcriptional regulator with XRE-family HTH domain
VTLARIESGEHAPRLETLLAIARGLKLPVEKLLT